MAPWFSASAVAPLIGSEWGLTDSGCRSSRSRSSSGSSSGALGLAVTGAADVVSARVLFASGRLAAAAANLGFATLSDDVASAVPFRFITGLALAGVYPIGLRLLAGWFRRERGLAIGVLVGALTIGSALPYLLRALGASQGLDWHATVGLGQRRRGRGRDRRPGRGVGRAVGRAGPPVQLRCGAVGLPAAVGPPGQSRLPRSHVGALRDVDLGPAVHRGELRRGRQRRSDEPPAWLPSRSSVPGGSAASRPGSSPIASGRTTVTIVAMAVSGTCAVLAGLAFGAAPLVTVIVCTVWGVTVVADSAQFSTAVSELSPAGTAGSALALQTALGFLLTGVTILLVGLLGPGDAAGWRLAFAVLALGPLVGIVAMARLRRRPEATLMASGNR